MDSDPGYFCVLDCVQRNEIKTVGEYRQAAISFVRSSFHILALGTISWVNDPFSIPIHLLRSLSPYDGFIIAIDVGNFTSFTSRFPVQTVATVIHSPFSFIDDSLDGTSLNKAETIGDSYLVCFPRALNETMCTFVSIFVLKPLSLSKIWFHHAVLQQSSFWDVALPMELYIHVLLVSFVPLYNTLETQFSIPKVLNLKLCPTRTLCILQFLHLFLLHKFVLNVLFSFSSSLSLILSLQFFCSSFRHYFLTPWPVIWSLLILY